MAHVSTPITPLATPLSQEKVVTHVNELEGEYSFSSYLQGLTQDTVLPTTSSALLNSVDSDKVTQRLSIEKIQDIYILDEIQRDKEISSKNNSTFSVIA